jgi:hypothetical protein
VFQGGRWRFALWALLAAVACGTLGCGASPRDEVPSDEDNLRNLTKLLGQFQARNQGRMPADDQEFQTFAREMSVEQLAALGIRDAETAGVDKAIEKVLVSTRDGEPYVIRYGQGSSMGGALPPGKEIIINPKSPGGGVSQPVIAHEKTGARGKRYVVFGMGQVELVDEARFQQLIQQ